MWVTPITSEELEMVEGFLNMQMYVRKSLKVHIYMKRKVSNNQILHTGIQKHVHKTVAAFKYSICINGI